MFYKDVKMLPSADILKGEYTEQDVRDAFNDGYASGKFDRPKGKWSNIDNYYGTAICTNCKKVTMFEKWGSKPIKQYDFCPNCGAKMEFNYVW